MSSLRGGGGEVAIEDLSANACGGMNGPSGLWWCTSRRAIVPTMRPLKKSLACEAVVNQLPWWTRLHFQRRR